MGKSNKKTCEWHYRTDCCSKITARKYKSSKTTDTQKFGHVVADYAHSNKRTKTRTNASCTNEQASACIASIKCVRRKNWQLAHYSGTNCKCDLRTQERQNDRILTSQSHCFFHVGNGLNALARSCTCLMTLHCAMHECNQPSGNSKTYRIK